MPSVVQQDDLSITTKKFAFQTLLEKASTAVPTRDVSPLLRNFYLEASEGLVRVAATDMELAIVASGWLVTTHRSGACVLPAHKMLAIVREAADGDLKIDVKDGTARIALGPTVWSVKIADSAEYPALPQEDDLELVEVDRTLLLSSLMAVRYAAARDALRFNFMAVVTAKGMMRASDGVRFAQVACAGIPDMQIPINAVDDLVKTLRATEAPKVGIGQDDVTLVFKIGGDTFVANKPTVAYPDVDEMMRKPSLANNMELRVDRDELVGAIKRVRITADEETSAVILELADGDGVTVRSQDKYGSWATETVAGEWAHGERRVVFNAEHLLEMLNGLEAKSASLKLGKDGGSTKPSLLLVTDDETGAEGILNQLRLDFVTP